MARQAGGYDGNTITASGTVKSEWNFDDTIRGTIKGLPVNLNLDELGDEEEDEGWDLEDEEVEVWDGTTRIRGDSLIIEGSLGSRNVGLHGYMLDSTKLIG